MVQWCGSIVVHIVWTVVIDNQNNLLMHLNALSYYCVPYYTGWLICCLFEVASNIECV